MRMIALMGLMLVAAVPAAAGIADDSFRDAKSGYRVDVSHVGSDMHLSGFNSKKHSRFEITVTRDGAVSGVVDGQKVNYVMPAATLTGNRTVALSN